MKYSGTWHIHEMKMWDEDYLNMDVQAYIQINSDGIGKFQFGRVSGEVDGSIVKDEGIERFEFTWDGNDESDQASGGGWMRLTDKDHIRGMIRLHMGDHSEFLAKRAE